MNIKYDFIDSCLWMSMRYSVGRHTIAAHYHAGEIAKFLRDNPKVISPECKALLGRDIKSEIGSYVHRLPGIHVDGFQEHHDALTLILDACVEHGIKPSEFFRYDFFANTIKGACEVEKNDREKDRLEAHYMIDIEGLLVWQRLAGYLDPTERIEWVHKGEKGSGIGFIMHSIDRQEDRFIRNHCTCKCYAENPQIFRYIADEYITNLEKI